MKYASIDVGTNTLRLLIAEDRGGGGGFRPLLYKRAITRLGGGYTVEAGMAPAAMERSIGAISEFSKIIRGYGVDRLRATATSVVRRAINRDAFTAEVRKRTGIERDVIDGTEEARLTLKGVMSVMAGLPERALVMDIGGGSTEFIATFEGRSAGSWSMEMGVVRLTEKYFRHDPPVEAERGLMEREIEGVIGELRGRMAQNGIAPSRYGPPAAFVGTAGTITTLAALDLGLDEYDRDRINNHTLSRERVEHFYRCLSALTIREKEEILALEKGREDLIIPGAAITLSVMEAFGHDEVRVSDAGLLEGIVIEMIEKTEVQ